MDGKKKNIIIGILIIGIISMTVAYATLSQQLTINGTAKVQARSDSWNIHFVHITNTANEVVPNGYSSVLSNSITLSENDTTATLPQVTLRAPGDSVDFYFDVINEGDITGYINAISNFNVGTVTFNSNETLSITDKNTIRNALGITLSYTNGNPVNINDSIAKGEKQNLKVTYTLSSALTILPAYDVTFGSITATINYGQSTVSGGTLIPVTPSAVLPLAEGSEVSFGTQEFNVLWTNSNQTALLAKYNLSKSTNIQSSSVSGNTLAFSSTSYWHDSTNNVLKSEYAKDVNGNPASYSGNPFPYVYRENTDNNLYTYINAYVNNLKTTYNAPSSITGRPASYDEMRSLKAKNGNSMPTWVQGKFWLGSTYNGYVWYINGGNNSSYFYYYTDDTYGIRPVIIVPTSELQ